MTRELEFHVSVTPVGIDEYLVRTEQVAPGVPLAEEQVRWPLEEWLAQARQLMKDPLLGLLESEKPYTGRDRFTNLDPRQELNLIALGQQLYNSLFQGTLRDSWTAAQSIAQHRREVLRLRLGLKGNRLPRLPWEVLHAGDRPIATGTNILFSRYQPNKGVSHWLCSQSSSNSSLKILMAIAAPTDRESLELKREALHLQQELQNRSARERATLPAMEITILEQPDRAALTQALEQSKYHVFHYAGHSNLGTAGGELYLVNRRTGLTETLNGSDLAGLLANNGIQLAVFNSCRGAHTVTADPTADSGERSLAEALVSLGIPAVLAMAERIPDDVALTLARLFYRNLNQGYPVDLSLSRARQGLISAYGSHQLYWALPILYLHPEFDGYLSSNQRQVETLYTPTKEFSFPLSQDEALLSSKPSNLEEFEELSQEEIEGILDEVEYDALNEPEVSGLVTDLLRQLSNSENNSSPYALSNVNQSLSDESGSKGSLQALAPPTPPNQASESQVSRAEIPPNRRRRSVSFWKMRGLGPLLWLLLCVLGIISLWHFRDFLLIGNPKPVEMPTVPPVVPTNPKFERLDLRKASTTELVAIAISEFSKGNLSNGQKAVETLLDRNALQEAKAALSAVPNSQKDEQIINFLYGRMAWQFVQSGERDYSLQDVRRYWEAVIREQPKLPLYYNALGFAYYADGDVNRASDMWSLVTTLEPEKEGQPASSGKTTQSRLSKDVAIAYAGRALVLWKSALNQPPAEQVSRLKRAIEFRQKVLASDPLGFQIDALSNDWLWPEVAIQDWRSLLALKEPVVK
ncbi:MAG: CHAT domain-containing protein [Oscillatoriaceae bacterium SKW80]|nr:CHAT domain-containing protein [Oscillatoriaceae bacterium SKYG93]MCX8121121.1 CHAT domain-containing protein [Oscillatoriaceae bacterium SKW80]MDW8453549.1 CHAT domain-containing protein [Oscillatoriaceae cyanobacterium SKYGB_i_bin93]HIK26900.1 CHAT domain-containing protein [Oscillatoriaceae cyanobacterium M7585_C2015_266]